MKTNLQLYCQYLMSSNDNYTATNLSEHYEGLSHDSVTRFLKEQHLTPSLLWEKVRPLLVHNKDACIIVDDSVMDKSYSHKIDGVHRQYSGNAHGIIKGIGVVNMLYYNPAIDRYWLIDFRIYDQSKDGKTKLDHVNEMLSLANQRGIVYATVLMDTWYATSQLMVRLQNEGKIFYCPIKTNRKVDDSKGSNPYKAVEQLVWTQQELQCGKTVKIWKTSKYMKVKLFRVSVSSQTEYIITNDLSQASADEALKQSSMRWKIEQLHREEKQLTGIEKCQCRTNRSQRNHILCCTLVWLFLAHVAHQNNATTYQVKHNLWKEYLTQQLKCPKLVFA
jgi:hypothetical protein